MQPADGVTSFNARLQSVGAYAGLLDDLRPFVDVGAKKSLVLLGRACDDFGAFLCESRGGVRRAHGSDDFNAESLEYGARESCRRHHTLRCTFIESRYSR